MRIMLEEDLAGCNTLEVVQRQAQETLRYFQDIGCRVVYVAGPISADGEAHIQRNIDRLIAARGDLLRQLGGRAVPFTAPFIFTPEVYERLDIFSMDPNVREAKMQAFWDELLLSGVVDDVYLAPGWERSAGARKERETAELAGIPVYQMFG